MSAHDDLEWEALKAAARQRLADGQGELELGLDTSNAAAASVPSAGPSGKPLEITSSRMGHLWDGLSRAYYCNGSCGASWDADACRTVMITAWSILPGGLSRWTRWWS